jgi:hypothetical protein
MPSKETAFQGRHASPPAEFRKPLWSYFEALEPGVTELALIRDERMRDFAALQV